MAGLWVSSDGLPHFTYVVKIHSDFSVVVIIIIIPAEVIITLSFPTSCLAKDG